MMRRLFRYLGLTSVAPSEVPQAVMMEVPPWLFAGFLAYVDHVGGWLGWALFIVYYLVTGVLWTGRMLARQSRGQRSPPRDGRRQPGPARRSLRGPDEGTRRPDVPRHPD